MATVRTKRPAKPKATKSSKITKNGNSFFSQINSRINSVRNNIKGRYQSNPPFYFTISLFALIIVATLITLWFNKGFIVAGTVNGELITTPEFYGKLVANNGQEVFDSTVREVLINQEAKKKGIEVTQAEIDEEIAGLEKRLGGKENLENALQQSNTSREKLVEQIKIQLLVEKILGDQIEVTDKEIEQYKKENKETTAGQSNDDIREILKSNKLSEKFGPWYQEIREKAQVNRYF